MLENITPLILTFNEAPNIGRVLDRLRWAHRVVVLDSGSDDATEEIAREHSNVSFVQRPFDSHANQWNHGLRDTGIATEWVLALDADYVLSEAFVEELRTMNLKAGTAGFSAGFRYCIDGVPLHGTAYPPVTVLYRRAAARYEQDGHTQRVQIDGAIERLHARIDHDDRKPFDRWFRSQIRYMRLEADKLGRQDASDVRLRDRVRKLIVVAPVLMFFYCMFAKGNALDGRAGLYYALQRSLAEVVLSLFLLQARLAPRAPHT